MDTDNFQAAYFFLSMRFFFSKVYNGLQTLELPSRTDHIEDLFSVFDSDQNGVIHYSEFEALALHRRCVSNGIGDGDGKSREASRKKEPRHCQNLAFFVKNF